MKAFGFGVISCALALMLTACATPVANYVPQTNAFSRPPLNTQHTVAVGEEMLSQGTLTERAGIQLRSEAHVSWYTLSAGFYPLAGRNAQGAFYGFQYMRSTRAGYGAVSKNILGDEPQSVMTTAAAGQICIVTIADVKVCGRGDFEPATRREESDDNFQQTLLYSGRVGDRIRLSYREFSGSMARPAFNNDVEYDLSTSDVVAYRGARIHVIAADNTQITYEVLSNFNTSPNR